MVRLGFVVIVFMLALMPLAAGAEIPPETLEKIALLRVEDARLQHQRDLGTLTPQEFTQRIKKLRSDEAALWQPYRRLPRDELNRASETIKGLTRARLATLNPQWAKEMRDRQVERRRQFVRTTFAVALDSRLALEAQRERLRLQKQLKAGALTRDEFAKKDAEALATIASLRRKFEIPQTDYAVTFDRILANLTNALGSNPDTVIPEHAVSELPPGQQPDYDADVRLAASILVKREQAKAKCPQGPATSALCAVTADIYNSDLAHLRNRYAAISAEKGYAFPIAYEELGYKQLKPPPPAPPPQPTETTTAWTPRETDHTGTLVVLAILIGVPGLIIAWIVYLIFRKKPPPEDNALPPLSSNFGTAAWHSVEQEPADRLAILRGVSFGKSSAPGLPPNTAGAPIASSPEAHTLIVARTRAGKGTRVIVPTLLRYVGSMLVIDPKGENAAITARTRRDQLHQRVHIVNPWGEMEELYKGLGFKTATFNPLDAIDRNDPNAVAVAQSLAATICPAMPGKDSYWHGSAANVLAGVFLWLSDQPEEQKTLARAREIVTMSRADFRQVLVRMMASSAFHGAIKEMVSQYIDLADETYSGIMSNLAERTKFLSDPRMKASTASSSFSMEALRDVLMTVYLVIPHERIETHGTWLRLVIAAATHALKKRGQLAPARHRCMFMIDEFGSIGRMEDMPRDIALMSGYGLDFTLIIQGLDQLKDHYGEARGTILSNCGYKWFCFVNDIETAKYLSESLGNKTVRTVGLSDSAGHSAAGATSGTSTNFGEAGRPLLMPDEILNLGRDVAILLHPRGLPYYLRPVDYWQLPRIYEHLKEEYPHFYWDPPLSFDANPYFKEPPPPPPRDARGRMSRKEALELLGLKEGATETEIKAAYRRLMAQIHPDKGGTDYLAAKLNEAREVLFG